MAKLKLPVTIRHGLTADFDWVGEGGVAHMKGVDNQMRPIQLSLTREELELLLAVQQKAEDIVAEQKANESAA